MRTRQSGFTMMEIMIVIAIIVMIMLMVMINMKTQLQKARDADRKADLAKIHRAFEEYFNDTQCYPPPDVLNDCGGTSFAPSLPKIPCDSGETEPYMYVPGSPDRCDGYHICAKLENLNDPDIAAIGCDPINGCGYGVGYNYCVAVGFAMTPPGFELSVSPTNTPSPTPDLQGRYACTPGGDCNEYADPAAAGCPQSWATGCPLGACSNVAKRCLSN